MASGLVGHFVAAHLLIGVSMGRNLFLRQTSTVNNWGVRHQALWWKSIGVLFTPISRRSSGSRSAHFQPHAVCLGALDALTFVRPEPVEGRQNGKDTKWVSGSTSCSVLITRTTLVILTTLRGREGQVAAHERGEMPEYTLRRRPVHLAFVKISHTRGSNRGGAPN